jgi:hypothetical protein
MAEVPGRGLGLAASDLEPYMGMPGHLIVRSDWQVFAHLHPAGSAPMASVALANGPAMVTHVDTSRRAGDHAAWAPQAGDYGCSCRSRAGRVETVALDAHVE